MSTPYEWRIDAIEQSAKNAERRLYEIDEAKRVVDRLECSVRELGSCVDGLRATCEACLERIERLERANEELTQVLATTTPASAAK
jgi:hypothetical protein